MEEQASGVSVGRLVLLFAVAAAVVLPVRAFVVEPISVASASMEPTLPVGRRLFVDKFTLRLRRVKRGEVVLLVKPVGDHEDMLKRVVAVGGDTIELREKTLYISGKPVEEPFTVHRRPSERLDGDNLGPLEVPAGHVFVLGDNRDESDDSAVWRQDGRRAPFVPENAIKGLVRGVY